MAGRAVLISRVRHVVRTRLHGDPITLTPKVPGAIVTLKTKRKDYRTAQKPSVHGPVRIVTSFTAFYPHSRMLESEWTALVDVAFEASLFVDLSLCHQSRPLTHPPRGGIRSVWVVTIRALHEALIDAMLERHRKLGPNLLVTTGAEIHLLLGQQVLGGLGLVDAVAVVADHLGLRVLGSPDIRARDRLLVATQTVVERLLIRPQRESEDLRLVATTVDVFFSWAMTALTSGLRGFQFGRNALVVCVPEEALPDVGMTAATGRASDEAGRFRIGLALRKEARSES